jgi:Ca2+/Na+ antiporter
MTVVLYFVAAFLGAISPTITHQRELRETFSKYGVGAAISAWFGRALVAIAIALALAFITNALIVERTHWIRGLPRPENALSAIGILLAGVLGLVIFIVIVRLALAVMLFLLGPLIRWLRKPALPELTSEQIERELETEAFRERQRQIESWPEAEQLEFSVHLALHWRAFLATHGSPTAFGKIPRQIR